jgi:malate dehydrogenase (oxaloacetate-decarboxylating)(NADP+)
LRPESTLPIHIDVGTNTQKYLDDPLYLGLRQRRIPDAEYDALMEEFLTEMKKTFPDLLLQFEDFNTPSAFRVRSILFRVRTAHLYFNSSSKTTARTRA